MEALDYETKRERAEIHVPAYDGMRILGAILCAVGIPLFLFGIVAAGYGWFNRDYFLIWLGIYMSTAGIVYTAIGECVIALRDIARNSFEWKKRG